MARTTRSIWVVWESLPDRRPARITGGQGKYKAFDANRWVDVVDARTIDDPFFDIGNFDLERGSDFGIRELAPNVLEAERGQ